MEDGREIVIHNDHGIDGREDQSFISQGTEEAGDVQYLHSDGVWRRWAISKEGLTGWFASVKKAKEILKSIGIKSYRVITPPRDVI